MNRNLTIGIIGDFNPGNKSHTCTNEALQHASSFLSVDVNINWLPTETLEKVTGDYIKQFDGFWCAPGSPYKNFSGALTAIKLVRELGIPFIGTCGGFQHSLLEYARNVLGINNADHEELSPESDNLFISKLACSLVGRTGTIEIQPDTLAYDVYKKNIIQEQFMCSFGLNPFYLDKINKKPLVLSGFDPDGEARIFELSDHPFFIGTLFIPQLSSSKESPHPLILKYLQAVFGKNNKY